MFKSYSNGHPYDTSQVCVNLYFSMYCAVICTDFFIV